jgi:transposase
VGYDAGKRVKGRKIHALVDSEGLPMRVVVHSAKIQDRDGAGLVLDKIRRRFPWLELIWADGGYNAWQVDAAVAKVPRLRLEIVKRSDDIKGFVVVPRRWVVERTFSWFGRNRRLAKDFENLAETLATFVTLASIQLTLRRLARVSCGLIEARPRKRLGYCARISVMIALPARSTPTTNISTPARSIRPMKSAIDMPDFLSGSASVPGGAVRTPRKDARVVRKAVPLQRR